MERYGDREVQKQLENERLAAATTTTATTATTATTTTTLPKNIKHRKKYILIWVFNEPNLTLLK